MRSSGMPSRAQVAIGRGAGREAEVGELVGEDAVDLLGHGAVEAPHPGLDVRHRMPFFCRHERRGERGVHVAVDHDPVGGVALEHRLERRACILPVCTACDPEPTPRLLVGRRQARGRGRRRRSWPRRSAGPVCTMTCSTGRGRGRPKQRRHLHEVGPCADDVEQAGHRRGNGERISEPPWRGARQVEREVEAGALRPPRSPPAASAPIASTSLRQMESPRPGAGEGVLARPLAAAERLVERHHRLRRDAPAGVAHRELDRGRRSRLVPPHLDDALVGELEGVGGEVEQHPAERHRVADPEVGVGRAAARTSRPFSSAIGSTMSRTDSKMSATENGIGSRSTSRSPPRASSITSLATELRPNAAL